MCSPGPPISQREPRATYRSASDNPRGRPAGQGAIGGQRARRQTDSEDPRVPVRSHRQGRRRHRRDPRDRADDRPWAAAGRASVYISSRKREAGEAAVAELAAHGRVVSVPADLAREEECTRLAAEIGRSEERIHVLVNNAGATWGAPLEEFPASAWDRSLDLNLKAPFRLTRAFRLTVPDVAHVHVVRVHVRHRPRGPGPVCEQRRRAVGLRPASCAPADEARRAEHRHQRGDP